MIRNLIFEHWIPIFDVSDDAKWKLAVRDLYRKIIEPDLKEEVHNALLKLTGDTSWLN